MSTLCNFVPITKCFGADKEDIFEVPLEPSGTLSIHTLRAAFPRASGLKFRPSSLSFWRTLRADESTLFPPNGGWRNNVPFYVIFDEPIGTMVANGNGIESPNKTASSNASPTASFSFVKTPTKSINSVSFSPSILNGTGPSSSPKIGNNINGIGGSNGTSTSAAQVFPNKPFNSAPNPAPRFSPYGKYGGRFKMQARKGCGGLIRKPLPFSKKFETAEPKEPRTKRKAAEDAQKATKKILKKGKK